MDDPAVEQALAAYAAARLEPDPAATARLREQILADARERLAPPLAAGAPVLTVVSGRTQSPAPLGAARVTGPRRASRWAFALVAAGLTLALAAGVVAAGSGPGGPFYGARLWVEELTLPSDPDSRAEAQLERLQERLQEAEQASKTGNGPAVKAALEAYRAQAEAAIAAAGDNLTREQRVELMLGKHTVVLSTLVGLLPEQASETLTRVLLENTRALDKLHEEAGKPTDAGKPSDTPGASPSAEPSKEPGKPAAEPSAKPSKEPGKPSDTPGGKPETPPGQQP
jgi:hypothetical protein